MRYFLSLLRNAFCRGWRGKSKTLPNPYAIFFDPMMGMTFFLVWNVTINRFGPGA
jgi:hypothetical protein